ncbi:MAG: hypothetical protein LBC10_01985 [Deltaproteobacteria bacterium]|nr:hypothetical protein [Deltaproteobacteria bacterium]
MPPCVPPVALRCAHKAKIMPSWHQETVPYGSIRRHGAGCGLGGLELQKMWLAARDHGTFEIGASERETMLFAHDHAKMVTKSLAAILQSHTKVRSP